MKAALNLTLELGEDVFPEPTLTAAALTEGDASAKSVEAQEPFSN